MPFIPSLRYMYVSMCVGTVGATDHVRLPDCRLRALSPPPVYIRVRVRGGGGWPGAKGLDYEVPKGVNYCVP